MIEATTKFLRSNKIESYHRIKILVKNTNNKILLKSGDINDLIFPRSSIKIFQAIPFIQSNAPEIYKLNSKSLALACSSHRGETYHVKELVKWLNKVGISEKKLKCGVHNPLDPKALENLFRLNRKPNELHNNCCGKHLAMLSTCILNKYDLKNYLDFNHPHQIAIRKIFEKFSGKKILKKNYGIDGCSAPQYSIKIKDLSLMLINLIKSYYGKFEYSFEVKYLINSILNNPKYIGGTDSFDSRIMSISNKKVFCKGGAEGVFLFADLKGGIIGIIKVIDGNERAIPYTVYNIFKKFKIMNNSELKKIEKIYSFKLRNHANITVGSINSKID